MVFVKFTRRQPALLDSETVSLRDCPTLLSYTLVNCRPAADLVSFLLHRLGACKSTASQVALLGGLFNRDVEVEDVDWQTLWLRCVSGLKGFATLSSL